MDNMKYSRMNESQVYGSKTENCMHDNVDAIFDELSNGFIRISKSSSNSTSSRYDYVIYNRYNFVSGIPLYIIA